MKKIAVFFNKPDAMGYPFSKPDYWQSYQEFNEEVMRQGGELYFVRGQQSYRGKGEFANSWKILDGAVTETGSVIVSAVYNKGRFNPSDEIPILNCQKISAFCVNKWTMYQQLQQYCPLTIKVASQQEVSAAVEQLNSEKIVFKPISGAEGKDVHIVERNQVDSIIEQLEYPILLQEFLDTSPGVPGIMTGIHDFRVALFDGSVYFAYVRTPPEGSLLANVAQGGSLQMVEAAKVPDEIKEICLKIDTLFSDCPHRFYSVDFGFTPDGPKIIEMNSQIGLFTNATDPIFKSLKIDLAKILLSY